MWIEMVRNTLVDGVAGAVGETLEVEEMLGEALVFMKKARLRQAQPAEAAVVGPDEAAAVVAEEKAILEPLELAETSRKRRRSR